MNHPMTTITVRYEAIDGARKTASFRTLAGARKFAQHWVGNNPDCGSDYAVSGDGVGIVRVEGCSIFDLFSFEAPDDLVRLYTEDPEETAHYARRSECERIVIDADHEGGSTYYAYGYVLKAEADRRRALERARHEAIINEDFGPF